MPMPTARRNHGKLISQGQILTKNDEARFAVFGVALASRSKKIRAVVELASAPDVEILRAQQKIAVERLANTVNRLVQRTILKNALVNGRFRPDKKIGGGFSGNGLQG